MLENLTWALISSIPGILISFVSLCLTFDTINTWHQQKTLIPEIEKLAIQDNFDSEYLLDKVLKLLDTRWNLPAWAQWVISIALAALVYVLVLLNLKTAANVLSGAVSVVSALFTMRVSRMNNRAVRLIGELKQNTTKVE